MLGYVFLGTWLAILAATTLCRTSCERRSETYRDAHDSSACTKDYFRS